MKMEAFGEGGTTFDNRLERREIDSGSRNRLAYLLFRNFRELFVNVLFAILFRLDRRPR